jgi:hypothetical protein
MVMSNHLDLLWAAFVDISNIHAAIMATATTVKT